MRLLGVQPRCQRQTAGPRARGMSQRVPETLLCPRAVEPSKRWPGAHSCHSGKQGLPASRGLGEERTGKACHWVEGKAGAPGLLPMAWREMPACRGCDEAGGVGVGRSVGGRLEEGWDARLRR